MKRSAHQVLRLMSVPLLCMFLAGFAAESARGQTGPLIDAQIWQGGVGVDGGLLRINTDADPEPEEYPIIPDVLANNTADVDFLISPDRSVLYARAWGDALSWDCTGTDNQIYFFELIQDTDTAGHLEAIFNGHLCIKGPFPDHDGLYEVPGQNHHTAYLVEAMEMPSSTRQNIHWFNLNVDEEHSVTDLNVDVDGLYFDFTPDGTAVLIKHGMEHPGTTADYTLVDLCPLPRLGNWLTSDVGGELFDLDPPEPYAEVIEYPVGTGVLWVHITHPDLGSDGVRDVLLEPCWGAPEGACCNGSVCTETTQAACTGTYQGNGTTCPHAACVDPGGACCVGGGCQITTAAGCSGAYQGDGTNCPHPACVPKADLSLTKVDDVDPVIAGGTLTYTLRVTNNGPDDATDVFVYDTMPPEVTADPALISPECTVLAGGDVSCYILSLASGATATFTIVGEVDPAALGTLVNNAEADANEDDPNLANNVVVEHTAVTTQANVSITLAAGPNPVMPGGTLVYVINVTNNGPSTATGVVVNNTLPPGVTLLNAQGNPTGMSLVDCDTETLSPGDTETVTILARVDPGESPGTILTNAATVSADPPDPDLSDNTALVDTTVGSPGGSPVTYTRIADEDTPIPGGLGTFTGFDPPAISGDFVTFTASGAGDDGIYRWIDGTLTAVADQYTLVPGGYGTFWFLSFFAHNYSISGPQVAFHAEDAARSYGIYITDACGIAAIVDYHTPSPSAPGEYFDVLWGPQIRDGSIAFHGNSDSGIAGIYLWDGSTIHIVADENTPIPQGNGNFINVTNAVFDGTDVAFWGNGDNGDGTYTTGIYVSTGGSIVKVADDNTPIPGGTGSFSWLTDTRLCRKSPDRRRANVRNLASWAENTVPRRDLSAETEFSDRA